MSSVTTLRPLLWTCAAFAGGVLLHADRVPAWAAGIALLLIAWRLLSAHRDAAVRQPLEAVHLAEHAVALTNRRAHKTRCCFGGATMRRHNTRRIDENVRAHSNRPVAELSSG